MLHSPYIYIQIYLHLHIHRHVHRHIRMYMYIYVYIRTCVHMYIYTDMRILSQYTGIHIYIQSYININHIHIPYT